MWLSCGCLTIEHSVVAATSVFPCDFASIVGGLKNTDNHSGVGCLRLQEEREVAEEIHDWRRGATRRARMYGYVWGRQS